MATSAKKSASDWPAGAANGAFALAIMFVVAVCGQTAQAQTFTVLHSFTDGADGGAPYAGVTIDGGGNLYGTTFYGGTGNNGAIYKLKHSGSGWTVDDLYNFEGGNDGYNPQARVIFGPNGTLYGTTELGSEQINCNGLCGTVFNLAPSINICHSATCPWTHTVLYDFNWNPDARVPGLGDVLFDGSGNIYGTTIFGGPGDSGAAYKLTSSGTESIVYYFGQSDTDGSNPYAGLIFDASGNLWGTTSVGGSGAGYGTVFELVPSGGSWTENIIYSFQNGSDGGFPYAGLIRDQSGNFYGATGEGGSGNGGTVFELSPSGSSWTFTTLYSFTGSSERQCGPRAPLTMDSSGNLYGTTWCDGTDNAGSVFKLTHSGSSWTYTSLHDFTGGSDGSIPFSNVVFDSSGNLYGTASSGGSDAYGVVWEITP
jgi:uncharacterized repeat protein (TIGR03803 family)